jgi:hypothetical protein
MSVLRPCLAYCLVAASLVPATVGAQSRAEEARRATLIQQATQARSRGEWPQVVRLLRQVIDIRATASVRLGLAGAYQELGQHNEAASQAALCMQSAPAERDLREEQRTAMVDACGEVLREATARLATVTVETVPDGVQGTTLLVDGEAVDGFAPGRPFYLTPGRRRLRLRASGQEEAEVTETLRAGATRTVRMTVRPAWGGAAGGSGRDPLQGAAASESPSAAPWVIGGLGVVAAGIGVGFFVDAQNTVTDNRGCTINCDQIREDISDSRAIGAAFAVAGGVATGVSLIWLLTRRNTPSRSMTSLRPSVSGISVSF